MDNEIKLPSNRSFGIVFFIVFLIIALWPIKNGMDLRLWSMIIAIIFLILGILNSKILTPLNVLWLKFGLLLGKIVSPIVMGLVFFVTVTPIGLLMRLLGKDLLSLKMYKDKSYWIKRDEKITTMKNQF